MKTSVISRINNTLSSFKISSRDAPRSLYLGWKEYDEMMAIPDEQIQAVFYARHRGERPQFSGMEIFKVDAKSHLAII